jgi:hypothetical protein
MGYLMTTYGRTIVVVSSALHISRRDALFWVHGVLGSYSGERVKDESGARFGREYEAMRNMCDIRAK